MGSSHSAALKWRRRGRRRRSRWGVSFLPLLQSQFFRTEKLDGILPVDKSTESGTQNIQFLSLLLVEVDLNQIFSNAIEVNVIIGP